MATCPICGLSLQKKSFARHVRLHGDVKPEVCPYCKKEFREKRSLEKHIRAIHEAERPFPCEHCTESFRNQIELKNHINRHLKDYPFKCDVCSMTFQKQEALTTHYRLHTGEKPFVCAVCSRGYRDRRELKKHQTTHNHSGQSAPIPGTGPVNIPPPNSASSASSSWTYMNSTTSTSIRARAGCETRHSPLSEFRGWTLDIVFARSGRKFLIFISL